MKHPTSKEQLREAGYQPAQIWLSPDAIQTLDIYQQAHGGNRSRAVNALILKHSAEGVAQEHPGGASSLEALVDRLGACVERLEGKQARQKPTPRPPWRKSRVDSSAIIQAARGRCEDEGPDFHRSQLWRDLQAQGVPVHNRASNFCSFLNKHKAVICGEGEIRVDGAVLGSRGA